MPKNKNKQNVIKTSANTTVEVTPVKVETVIPKISPLKKSIIAEAEKYGFNYVVTYKSKVSFANNEQEALNDKKKFNGVMYKNDNGDWVKC